MFSVFNNPTTGSQLIWTALLSNKTIRINFLQNKHDQPPRKRSNKHRNQLAMEAAPT
jgi:hypothetical protein